MTTRVDLIVESPPVARIRFTSDNGIQLLTRDVRERLSEILDELHSTPDLSIVVLEAEGRVFIAGADINELIQLTSETAYESSRAGHALMNRLATLPATTVIAIHGACAGGGCEMALACDMRLAAESAVIGLPETKIGILPGWGGSVRATQLLGSAAAKRLILTGELIPGAKAMALGLVDEVAPDASFREAVENRLRQITFCGPAARSKASQLIDELDEEDSENRFEAEARAFASCFETDEPQIGMRAFLDKTQPCWQSDA